MSDDQKNQNDIAAAWSVRGVPADIRSAALRHAKKDGVSVGDWVTSAVREKIKADRNRGKDVVIRGPVSMSDADRVISMLQGLATAGVEIPTSLQRSAVSMLTKVTREVSKGQPKSEISQTVKGSGQTTTANGSTEGEKEAQAPFAP
ncbi:hypothetical protein [Komagataeibacter europaeus]|nr:hypothetical protein [Komagataeibacter europaeus]